MKRFVYGLVFMLLSISAFSRFENLRFGNFNSHNGLSSDYINDLAVDHQGYLWLATWEGLCRFDGRNWLIYKHIDGDSASIPSSGINSVYVDAFGTVWIGTDAGICSYNAEYNNFNIPKQTVKNRPNSERTYSISALPNNKALLICSVNGPYLYDFSDKMYKLVCSNANHEINRLPAVIAYAENNSIFLGTAGRGLWFYDGDKEKLYHLNEGKNAFFEQDMLLILGFAKIDSQHLLLATSEGVVNFNYKKFVLESVIDEHSVVNSLFVYKNNKVWVGKINEPIKIIDFTTKREEVLPYFYANNQKIAYNSATKIVEDKIGNLWIGTHGNGLFYWDKHYNKILQYSISSPLQKGLKGNIVSCFYEQEPGKMWVGTDGGGLHLFDQIHNTFELFDVFKSKAILDIKPADGKKLWISSYGGGLSLLNPSTKEVKNYLRTGAVNSPPCNDVRCICSINDTCMYVAFVGFGVGIFNPKTEKFKTMLNDTSLNRLFSANRWCNHILYDSKKNIWFATSYGLILKRASSYQYFYTSDSANSLSDNIVNFIIEDSKNRILIGTNRGLDLWDEKTSSFVRLKTKLPISGNFKSAVEDYHGNLWFGTNSGIVKIDENLTSVQNYNEFDGLQSNQFFLRATYRTKDNQLFFGGLAGFNIIDSKLFYRTIPQTPIVFTDFQVLNKTQIPSNPESVLKTDINYTDTVTLHYEQSMLGFEFTNMDILGVGKIKYQYRLLNFKDEWFDADRSNRITYTNLDPGYYTLEIRSSNRFGSWSKPSLKRLTIHILTPWWKTWWFRASVIMVIVSLLTYEFSRYRNRNKILTQMVRQRTKELEKFTEDLLTQNAITKEQREELFTKNQEIEAQKSYIQAQNNDLQSSNDKLMQSLKTKDKFMSIIGHDLKNPISAIIGISDLACNSFDKYSDQKKLLFYKTIHTSAVSIFELLESLLLWARTQTGNVEYKPEKFEVKEIIKQVYDLLHDSATKKQIEIVYTVDDACSVIADKNMLNTIVRNLVSNAIKFTPREGTITIDVHQAGFSKVKFRVCDTGQGMTDEQIASLFLIGKTKSTVGTENETGTGLGLILCSEFLKMHKSSFCVESEVEKGTTFSFELESA